MNLSIIIKHITTILSLDKHYVNKSVL